jgi:hypothetical protein
MLAVEGPQGITTLVQKMGEVTGYGVVREDYRPVTSTGVEQLAGLTFHVVRTRSREVRFAAENIRRSMTLIARLVLALPDSSPMNHSTLLGAYYSATSTQGLSARLTQLINAVSGAPTDDKDAQRIARNIEEWANQLYATEKELLLEAIVKRSQFTFDMLHWITYITSILLALSTAPACDARTRDKLRRHARWLISVLSFVPRDEQSVRFVENFQMTEKLFISAMDAHNRGCHEIAADISGLLVSWTFDAGQHQNGWSVLERGIYGLAALTLLRGDDGSVQRLKMTIVERLARGAVLSEELLDRAALEIRGRAATLYERGHWGSAIEEGVAQVDDAKLRPLLEDIADLLSPRTAGQVARSDCF